MFANPRITLGVAFLSRRLTLTTSAKCILHAEFVIATKQYILTKVTYTHSRSMPINVKTSETECGNICEVLKKLSTRVAGKVEEGFIFDTEGMEILNEVDEAWGDFDVADESEPSMAGSATLEMMTTSRVITSKRKTSPLEMSGMRAARSKERSLKHLPSKQRHH